MGEFGEIRNTNNNPFKLYIKTTQGGEFRLFKTPYIALNPPFDIIEGNIRLDDIGAKLRFFINGVDSSEMFKVAQSGKIYAFELLQNPILFTKSINLELSIYKE